MRGIGPNACWRLAAIQIVYNPRYYADNKLSSKQSIDLNPFLDS